MPESGRAVPSTTANPYDDSKLHSPQDFTMLSLMAKRFDPNADAEAPQPSKSMVQSTRATHMMPQNFRSGLTVLSQMATGMAPCTSCQPILALSATKSHKEIPPELGIRQPEFITSQGSG